MSEAVNDPATNTEAISIIRDIFSEISLIPNNGNLAIELVGELAGLLALGKKQNARGNATGASVKVVAGVGFEPTTFRL